MILAGKINKIPEFYTIFARKMSEFYIIIAGKIFLACASYPPSPTPTIIQQAALCHAIQSVYTNWH